MESRDRHREVVANGPDKLIKNEKQQTCVLIDGSNTTVQEFHTKLSEEETKI
jgi:hypothetical protein